MSDRLLENIRVIEMEGASCAFCGKLLADMGAEVIKIEPEGGDVTRTIPPFLHDEEGVENSLFHAFFNAGKKSMVLDWAGEGREEFLALIRSADVLLDDALPGDMEEKGFSFSELRKANPNLGVSITVDYLLEEIAVAEGSLSKKAEFICKYCNIKQNSSLAWLPAQVVNGASGEHMELEDFSGCYCVGGIDLSQTRDLTACTAVIEKGGKLYVFAHFFLPAERIDEATQRDGIPYMAYVQRGILTLSGDNFVDYHNCFRWFADLVEKYKILPLKVGYDRYSAQYLVQDMSAYGFHMDDVYQGENLYGVIQETQGMMEDGKICIGDNDLLKIHLLNSAIKMSTERGRGKLVKLSPSVHIDGTAALLDAMTVRQKYYAEIGAQLRNEKHGTV